MENRSYHHGNLKQALIEEGIHMINEQGMTNLSLRKLANACHVSHAAPYNHFKDKDALIQAIKDHITEDFSQHLTTCMKQYEGKEDLLVQLGLAYIQYFIEHKHYYRFLVSFFNFHVQIEETTILCDDFSAFTLYEQCATTYMKKYGSSDKDIVVNILATWAIVEGLTSIFVSDHTICNVNQEHLIEEILTNRTKLVPYKIRGQ